MLGSVSSRIILAMVFAGVLLSLWHVAINEVVNRDAAAYLLAAAGDWSQGARVTRWPFYPLMLQWLSGVFQTDAETIAYASNVIFDAITLYFFLRVVRLFGGTRLTLFWAGLAFLALTYFNDNRSEIIRDHGYWAAFMAAVWYYIRLFRVFSWGRVVGWTIAMLVASLFRVEGLVFLVLAPLGLLLNGSLGRRQRVMAVLKTWLPILGIAIAVLLALWLWDQLDPIWQTMQHNIDRLYLMVTKVIPAKAAIFHEQAIPFFSQSEVLQGFYIVLGWGILNDFITALSPLFLLLFLFRGWFPVGPVSPDASRIIWIFVATNLIVLMFWVVLNQIMVARYTLIIAFFALIWISFALAGLHERYRSSRRGEPVRIQFIVVVLALVAMLADGIIEGRSNKIYIVDTGQWIQKNLPKNSTIAANYDPVRLRYYANKGLSSQPVFRVETAVSTEPVDYLVIRLRNNELADIEELGSLISSMQQMHVIRNEAGGGFMVFQR